MKHPIELTLIVGDRELRVQPELVEAIWTNEEGQSMVGLVSGRTFAVNESLREVGGKLALAAMSNPG